MEKMQSRGVGTLMSWLQREAAEEQPPGQLWVHDLGGAGPSWRVQGVFELLANSPLGRWRWQLGEARSPALSLLEGRRRSAQLLVLVDEPSAGYTALMGVLQAAALLGNEPLAFLLDLSEHVARKMDAHIQTQAAALGLDHVHTVWVGEMEACAQQLGRTLLQMTGLRAAFLSGPLRLQVQAVLPGAGLAVRGELLQGSVAPGERVRLLPSGQVLVVRAVIGVGNSMPLCGDVVTLDLEGDAEVEPGDLISAANDPVESEDEFQVRLICDGRQTLSETADWQLCLGPAQRLRRVHVQELRADEQDPGRGLLARLRLDAPVAFEPSPALGPLRMFSLHEAASGRSVAAGMLVSPCRAASNIHRQAVSIDKQARAGLKGQRPCVLWFTGLSGAGKSTIANLVEQRLHALGQHTYLLDGDNVRHGLNRDLGFSDAARAENIRRVAEVAKLMVDAGLIVLTAFISPFRAERDLARHLLAEGEFVEVFVDAPLAVAEQRDVKGLYRKARRGELKGFTGIDAPYEAPEHPELRLDTSRGTADMAADAVVALLLARGMLGAGDAATAASASAARAAFAPVLHAPAAQAPQPRA